MHISDGARGLLSKPLEAESDRIMGETTSFSDHKGDSCITRVFRGSSQEEVKKIADEWIRIANEKCLPLASDIIVRKMLVSSLGGESGEEEDCNMVVALSCYDLILMDEDLPDGRGITTPEKSQIFVRDEDPSAVDFEHTSATIGRITATIRFYGENWQVRYFQHLAEDGTRGPMRHGSKDVKTFGSLQEAIDDLEEQVRRETEEEQQKMQKERERRAAATVEINQVFGEIAARNREEFR